MDACALCLTDPEIETAPLREQVHLTPQWRVVVHRSGLPGWLLVVSRRHVVSLDELSNPEAEEVGTILREATDALKRVVGCDRTYVLMFAEGTPHVHFSVVPRPADMPQERLGAGVVAYNRDDSPISDDQRDALAEQLHAAWPDASKRDELE